MKTNNPITLKPASFGSISTGTLRTQDLLSAFISEGESQQLRNGAFLATPEGMPLRDRLAKVIGEAQDAFADDGETLSESGEEFGEEIVNDFCDVLSEFAPAYGDFGAHCGDGADFGYWVDVESVKEQVEFVSSRRVEFPADDFRGEWLHVNERGNCALYVRESDETKPDGYTDRELWSIV